MGSFNIFKKNKKVDELTKMIKEIEIEQDKLKSSEDNKKLLRRVRCNIPQEIRYAMDTAEEFFNYYYSKLNSTKSVFYSSETKNRYIVNMNFLFVLYCDLFSCFGKGSLKEDEINKKYEKFKKTIDTYTKKVKTPLDYSTRSHECIKLATFGYTFSNKYFYTFKNKSDNFIRLKKDVIDPFKNRSKNFECLIDDMVEPKNKSNNFRCLIDNMIKSFDEYYYSVGNMIKSLKNEVIEVGGNYFAELRIYMENIKKCRSYIDDSKKYFLNLDSKIDRDFLSKKNSDKLKKLNNMTSDIKSGFEGLYSELDEYYEKILEIMYQSKKFDKEKLERIMILTEAKKLYFNKRESFLEMLLQNFKFEEFQEERESFIDDGINLIMIFEKKEARKSKILKSNIEIQPKQISQFKLDAGTLKSKMDEITKSSKDEIAEIIREGSPMRKVEKVIGTLQKIGNAMEVCNKIVKNAVPILGKVIG